MLTQQQIKEVITDHLVGDAIAWQIDVTNSYYEDGQEYYLKLVPKHIEHLAHAITCKKVYNGRRKFPNAIRRLIKMIDAEELEKAYDYVKGLLK